MHICSASAINVLEGSLISGKVLKNERGFAWVEAGFRTCAHSELRSDRVPLPQSVRLTVG